MKVLSWHWIDDRTMMVQDEGGNWWRCEGVYPVSCDFGEPVSSEEMNVELTMRYSDAETPVRLLP